jgi:prepilin-type N-terminal cleavage/methylation domain-containing protein/prepilin-type processing-associated H-X9-DG protein
MNLESAASPIGLINLDRKTTGKRSAGNPHAAFDEAGAGNDLYCVPRQFSTLLVDEVNPIIRNSLRLKGFSLVELLVVIAIISVLMAILLPALNTAKMMGKKINCLSNLKQWGLAAHYYLNDNNDFPPNGQTFGGALMLPCVAYFSTEWAVCMAPYFGISANRVARHIDVSAPDIEKTLARYPDIFYCTGRRRAVLAYGGVYYGSGSSYHPNFGLYETQRYLPIVNPKFSRLPKPSNSCLLGDAEGGNNTDPWWAPSFYFGHMDLDYYSGTLKPSYSHGRGGNELFVDGHAVFYTARDFRAEQNKSNVIFRRIWW